MWLWWLLAVGHGADRDPLPAREIERPLVLPRGWTRLGLDLRRQPGPDVAALGAGVGVLPRVELYVVAPVGAADPVIGARTSLWRVEPPNRSVALDTWFEAPNAAAASVAARAQLAGLGIDGAAGGLVRGSDPGLLARSRVFVQVGPLVPGVAAAAEWVDGEVDSALEVEVRLQASRGLALASAWGWPRALSLRVEAWL